jgi:OOP family OmpA-OmpF porin
MRDALDEIHLQQSDALSSFDGNCESFEAIRPILNGLLQVQFKKQQKKSAYRLWVVVAIVLVAVSIGIFRQMAGDRRWRLYTDQLRNQPGIVVTQVKEQDGQRHIYGLKDPYATDPSALMAQAGISPETTVFHWEPYQSAHPQFVNRRITTLFNPPPTIRMAFTQGTVQVSGTALHRWIEASRHMARIVPWIDHYADQRVIDIDARLERPATVTLTMDVKTLRAGGSAPRAWIERARKIAGSLPGIEAYDDARLIDADARAWESLSRTITEAVFFFQAGNSMLEVGQENNLEAFFDTVRGLNALSQLLGRNLRIDVIGHAD